MNHPVFIPLKTWGRASGLPSQACTKTGLHEDGPEALSHL